MHCDTREAKVFRVFLFVSVMVTKMYTFEFIILGGCAIIKLQK